MNLHTLNILIVFFTFGCLCSFILAFGQWRSLKRQAVLNRLDPWLERNAPSEAPPNPLNQPLNERLLRPALKRIAQTFSRWMPSKAGSNLAQRLIQAGNPGGLSPSEFAALQYASTFGLAVVALVISSFIAPGISNQITSAAACGILGYLLPDIILRYKIKQRQEAAVKSLPDCLDLLLVSVEAGMGFDGALQKVTEKSKGMLSLEFSRLLNEMRMGKPKRDAFRGLGDRIGTDEFASFVSAIVQSEQLGVSIGNVLRLQAAQVRQQRRQKAEEKAMKAPVKMLFPLVFFIFPTIFVVLLGPAALKISEFFN